MERQWERGVDKSSYYTWHVSFVCLFVFIFLFLAFLNSLSIIRTKVEGDVSG